MTIRFQADYDFNQDIIAGVIRREPRIDFQTGHDAGLKGRSDDEVLELNQTTAEWYTQRSPQLGTHAPKRAFGGE